MIHIIFREIFFHSLKSKFQLIFLVQGNPATPFEKVKYTTTAFKLFCFYGIISCLTIYKHWSFSWEELKSFTVIKTLYIHWSSILTTLSSKNKIEDKKNYAFFAFLSLVPKLNRIICFLNKLSKLKFLLVFQMLLI